MNCWDMGRPAGGAPETRLTKGCSSVTASVRNCNICPALRAELKLISIFAGELLQFCVKENARGVKFSGLIGADRDCLALV